MVEIECQVCKTTHKREDMPSHCAKLKKIADDNEAKIVRLKEENEQLQKLLSLKRDEQAAAEKILQEKQIEELQ